MNNVPMKEFMTEYLYLTDIEVVEKICHTFNKTEMEALIDFLNSETYKMCTDVNKSMWDMGSGDIFDMWVVEKVTGNPKNINFLRTENKYE